MLTKPGVQKKKYPIITSGFSLYGYQATYSFNENDSVTSPVYETQKELVEWIKMIKKTLSSNSPQECKCHCHHEYCCYPDSWACEHCSEAFTEDWEYYLYQAKESGSISYEAWSKLSDMIPSILTHREAQVRLETIREIREKVTVRQEIFSSEESWNYDEHNGYDIAFYDLSTILKEMEDNK